MNKTHQHSSTLQPFSPVVVLEVVMEAAPSVDKRVDLGGWVVMAALESTVVKMVAVKGTETVVVPSVVVVASEERE
jgi:hypothetical protein